MKFIERLYRGKTPPICKFWVKGSPSLEKISTRRIKFQEKKCFEKETHSTYSKL